MDKDKVIDLIFKELEKAQKNHPDWPLDAIHAAAIIEEESGELLRAAIDFNYHNGKLKNMKNEAVQTAAMAIRFLINSDIFLI